MKPLKCRERKIIILVLAAFTACALYVLMSKWLITPSSDLGLVGNIFYGSLLIAIIAFPICFNFYLFRYETYFSKARKMFGKRRPVTAEMASFYHFKDAEKALLYIEKAIALTVSEPNPEYYNLYGCLLYCVNRDKDAIDAFTKAVELKNDAQYFSNRGYLHFRCKHYDEALSDYASMFERQKEKNQGISWEEVLTYYEKILTVYEKRCDLTKTNDCKHTIESLKSVFEGELLQPTLKTYNKDYKNIIADRKDDYDISYAGDFSF